MQLKKIKEELFKKERELLNYEEMIEEKRIVQLIKSHEDIVEANESIKESDIVTNKLIRYLRQLELTYTFNEESLLHRMKRMVDD